jgi:hypothetical protein
MKCSTPDCTNEAPLHGGRVCYKCIKRKYRAKYPLKAWYDTLKMNAKRRGKEFTLTLEQFSEFCKKTGYDEKKGKTADSLSIDRRRDTEGYHANNIRAITLSENTKRQFDSSVAPEENCPF